MEFDYRKRMAVTKSHDDFVNVYNEYLIDVSCLISEIHEQTEEERKTISEIHVRFNMMVENMERIDKLLDQLGFWHRIYRTTKRVLMQAANQELNTN